MAEARVSTMNASSCDCRSHARHQLNLRLDGVDYGNSLLIDVITLAPFVVDTSQSWRSFVNCANFPVGHPHSSTCGQLKFPHLAVP